MTENHSKKISAKESLSSGFEKLQKLKKVFYKFLRSFGLQLPSKESVDSSRFQKSKSRTLRKLKILLKQELKISDPKQKSKIAQFNKIETDSSLNHHSNKDEILNQTDSLSQKMVKNSILKDEDESLVQNDVRAQEADINSAKQKKQISHINSDFWKEKSELAINITEAEASENLSNEAGVISKSLLKNSIGQILKEARTALGLTIEKVSQNLRVSAKDILALEDDEIERISKNIYTIGFIHSYGRILQVNPKIIESKLREIDWQSNTKNKVYNLVNVGKSFDLKPSGDIFLKFLFASSAALILALFIFSKIEDKSGNIDTDRITSQLQKIQMAKEANQ